MARSADHVLDEVDVSIIDALHLNPRASFETLGAALALSPVTVARRWQRLTASGQAWVSSVPGPTAALVGAVYEANVAPGKADEVAQALAAIPQVVSVYLSIGEFDLHALVLAADVHALSALLFDRLPAVPGTTRARSHLGTGWFSGVHWRLGAIGPDEEETVREGRQDLRLAVRDQHYSTEDRALYLALQPDGRARYRDLAQDLGLSEHLVRRRMATLTRRAALAFRTDFSRGEGGWGAQLVLWLEVPDAHLHEVGNAIATWGETRICLSSVGAVNLFVLIQLHTITQLGDVVARIHQSFPSVTVRDQRVILRPVKSWGRLLDRSGRAVGVVAADPWAD